MTQTAVERRVRGQAHSEKAPRLPNGHTMHVRTVAEWKRLHAEGFMSRLSGPERAQARELIDIMDLYNRAVERGDDEKVIVRLGREVRIGRKVLGFMEPSPLEQRQSNAEPQEYRDSRPDARLVTA